jgi:hypothetical protein
LLTHIDGKPGIGLQVEGKGAILADKSDEGTDSWFNEFANARAEVLEKDNKAKGMK